MKGTLSAVYQHDQAGVHFSGTSDTSLKFQDMDLAQKGNNKENMLANRQLL
jgi:hypothetical protein